MKIVVSTAVFGLIGILYAQLYISDIRADRGSYSRDAIDQVRLVYPLIAAGGGFVIGLLAQIMSGRK